MHPHSEKISKESINDLEVSHESEKKFSFKKT